MISFLIFTGFFPSNSIQARIDPGAIIGIWLFDDEDKFVVDSSGNGHQGEIIGKVKWVDGKFGKGLEFPGASGNYVKVPHHEDLNLTSFTITYWCKMGITAGWQIPIAKAAGSNRNFDFQTPAGGGTVSLYFTQGAGQWKGVDGKTTITDNSWHHIAGTYDLETLKIYIDGAMEKEGKYKGSPDHVEEPLTFGDMQNGHPMGGVLDEVGIFSVALSDADIQNIKINGLSKATGITSVSYTGKTATTWANIKN